LPSCPSLSIVYHVDRGDLRLAHRKLHRKFAISGGVPNFELAYRSPAEVRETVRAILRDVAAEGGYILDASAIMQNEVRPENVRAMTEAAREFGVYDSPTPGWDHLRPPAEGATAVPPAPELAAPHDIAPGICRAWEEEAADHPPIQGDPELVRRIWHEVEGYAHAFIWQVLLSF